MLKEIGMQKKFTAINDTVNDYSNIILKLFIKIKIKKFIFA